MVDGDDDNEGKCNGCPWLLAHTVGDDLDVPSSDDDDTSDVHDVVPPYEVSAAMCCNKLASTNMMLVVMSWVVKT